MTDAANDPRLTDESLKRRYAAEMVRDGARPHYTAQVIIGYATQYDMSVGALAGNAWPTDEFVLAEMQRIREQKGEAALIPTKETIALELLSLAREQAKTVADRLNAYRLFNDVVGYGQKALGSGPVTNVMANKVMMVKDKGDEASWSAGLMAQQEGLIRDARGDTKH